VRRSIERQTVQQIVDSILAVPAGRRMMILAPVVTDRKGDTPGLEDARKAGFVECVSTAQSASSTKTSSRQEQTPCHRHRSRPRRQR